MAVSKRQQKFARLIQKDLSHIIQKNKMGIFANSFVTVADVRMSPDLGIAKVYLSMLLVKDKDQMLEKVNIHKNEIRRELGLMIGKQVRKIPGLIFYVDEVEEQAARMDKLIDNLDIPGEDRPGPES